METQTTIELADAVKSRQAIVPDWMAAFADDQLVVVTSAVTFAGTFVVDMVNATPADEAEYDRQYADSLTAVDDSGWRIASW